MKIRSLAEAKLRDLCDSLTPERRKAVVIGLCTVFAAVNFYMIFRAIYVHRLHVVDFRPVERGQAGRN